MTMFHLLLLVSAFVYLNSIDGDFVHDDLSAIKYNRDVINSTSVWTLLADDFWGTPLADPRSHKSYRPLTVLTFRWNFLLGGLEPRGFHLVNVSLHVIVTGLFAWTCRCCLKTSQAASLMSATLFAIHPIHTEAVAGLVGRADILATLFFLSSFICYHRFIKEDDGHSPVRWRLLYWTFSVFCSLAALAAKENGIAALPVAVLWDVTRFKCSQQSAWRLLRRSTITCLSVMAMLLWRLSFLHGQLPAFSDQDNPVAFCNHRLTRLLTLAYLPAVNMGLLLAPVDLSYDWQTGSIPLIRRLTDIRNAATVLFYASACLSVTVAVVRKRKVLMWSLLVMIVPMLPSSNIFYPVGFVVAERLLYLPSLGFCLLVGHGLCRCWTLLDAPWLHQSSKRSSGGKSTLALIWLRLVIVMSTGALLASLTLKTWHRNADWSSRTTLFTSGLKTLPDNAKMHYNYGNLCKDAGHFQLAIHHYRQAIRLWPTYSSAHNNLGTLLLAQGEQFNGHDQQLMFNEAQSHFLLAIASHPQHAHAHYNLAILNLWTSNVHKALLFLERCLSLEPQHREANRLIHWLTDQKRNWTADNSDRNRTGTKDSSWDIALPKEINMADLMVELFK